MWEQLYSNSLYNVGLEMGQKLAHNLMPRPELLEWLRRTRTALRHATIEDELKMIRTGFVKAYGANGHQVFDAMVSDIAVK